MPARHVDVVNVTIEHAGEEDVKITIPAFTRPRTDMVDTLSKLCAEYLATSEGEGAPTSMGDFALFALVKAAGDPHFVETD